MNTFIIGTRNTSTQDLAVGDTVDLGSVYRKYVCRGKCGLNTYELSGGDAISLQHSGFYHITATLTFTAPAAGVVTFQLASNDVALIGATASETITTADTEVRTTTIDYYVLVNKGCVAGIPTTLIENISIINTGVASTVTNVVVNIEKL